VPRILITGPNKVDWHGVHTVLYMLIADDDASQVLQHEVNGDRASVRKQLAKLHRLPEKSVTFDPHYDDNPTPDFDYEFRRANYELGLTKLRTNRFPTGAAGTPNDVKSGSGGQVWFTGSANCVGRLDDSRKLTIFPRNVGHMPTIMRWGELDGQYGWSFLDPEGRRIGFVGDNGKFGREIELETGVHPTQFGANRGVLRRGLVATDGGIVVDLDQDRRFKSWVPQVDAIGIADDLAWQISGSRLVSFYAGHDTGERWQALQGGESKPGAMFEGAPNAWLIYMDPGRDVIGFVESYDRILEVKLPAGTGIRAMNVISDDTIWFTGKGGQSLFRLDRQRTVKEYPCATADCDLFQLDSGSQCLWFTEPKHNCVTFADISNL
jgi:hypothetical protein